MKTIAKQNLALIFSLTPVFIYIYHGFLLQNDQLLLQLFGGIIQWLLKSGLPKNKLTVRPPNAKNCNLFFYSSKDGGKPGMPSGHAMTSSIFVTHQIITFQNGSFQLDQDWYKIIALVLLQVGVMWSRVYLNCHTVLQTVVGTLIGILVAVIFQMEF